MLFNCIQSATQEAYIMLPVRCSVTNTYIYKCIYAAAKYWFMQNLCIYKMVTIDPYSYNKYRADGRVVKALSLRFNNIYVARVRNPFRSHQIYQPIGLSCFLDFAQYEFDGYFFCSLLAASPYAQFSISKERVNQLILHRHRYNPCI